MNESLNTTTHQALLACVETRLGVKPVSPQDFFMLRDAIKLSTHESISISTLKRLWGYVPGYDSTRISTLNVLSRYIGYRNWQNFCESINDDDISAWGTDGVIAMSVLKAGDRVEVTWEPGRRIVAEYMGQGRMRVTESERSKLAVGDTFSCAGMLNGERLVLTQVQHKDAKEAMTYVCGKRGGIKARILPD